MEFILHYMYMVAIKDAGAWQGDSPLELSMIGFWNLIIVWLKVTQLYSLFRLSHPPHSFSYLGVSSAFGPF